MDTAIASAAKGTSKAGLSPTFIGKLQFDP
jgi:hypothetical protein